MSNQYTVQYFVWVQLYNIHSWFSFPSKTSFTFNHIGVYVSNITHLLANQFIVRMNNMQHQVNGDGNGSDPRLTTSLIHLLKSCRRRPRHGVHHKLTARYQFYCFICQFDSVVYLLCFMGYKRSWTGPRYVSCHRVTFLCCPVMQRVL